jgi:SpoVK/Ycf46/Vps4 family AAA+-type ATPase
VARADLLVSLAEAATVGDQRRVRQVVEAMIAEERDKQHTIVARDLTRALEAKPSHNGNGLARLGAQPERLVYEVIPERKLGDLVLPEAVAATCRQLAEEHHRSDLLRSHNLEPRSRVLLTGPPGNGKTSLAEAIATEILAPLFVVRYEAVVGSFLGETAARLLRLFDFARTHRCVLFFDEFDTLAKERGDEHETGEVKRVVSSLLLQIDQLPSHVLVVTATNHPELLDRAVWRRFQVRLDLPRPSRQAIQEWFDRFQARSGLDLGYTSRTLADKLLGTSYAEVEEFALGVQRRYVLSLPDANLREIVRDELVQRSVQVEAA